MCAPGQDGCYLIFISRSVLILIAPYGTHENHSGDTEVKILCKEYVPRKPRMSVSKCYCTYLTVVGLVEKAKKA